MSKNLRQEILDNHMGTIDYWLKVDPDEMKSGEANEVIEKEMQWLIDKVDELIEYTLRWDSKNLKISWCNLCDRWTLYCPECGANECGAVMKTDCKTCDTVYALTKEFYKSPKIDELLTDLTKGNKEKE